MSASMALAQRGHPPGQNGSGLRPGGSYALGRGADAAKPGLTAQSTSSTASPPGPKTTIVEEISDDGEVVIKKEVVSDDGETVFRSSTDDEDPTVVRTHSSDDDVDADVARLRVYDDDEVVVRETDEDQSSGSEEEMLDDGEVIIRRTEDDHNAEKVIISDDGETVIRTGKDDTDHVIISDDGETVIHTDVSGDGEVVTRRTAEDEDPEVVRTTGGDPEVVIRSDDDPEIVRTAAADQEDPEVVRLAPSIHTHKDRPASPRHKSHKEKERQRRWEGAQLPFVSCSPKIAEDLLRRVLSFLEPRDLCLVALVSKGLKQLTDDDELWERHCHRRYNYTTKPDSRTWKEVFGLRARFLKENRIRARRENYAIVDGRVVDVVAVKTVEKGRQGLVTMVLGFDVFNDALLEGRLGSSFVPVVLSKEECPIVDLTKDGGVKIVSTNGAERVVPRPPQLSDELFQKGAKLSLEMLSAMGRERALSVLLKRAPP